MEFNEVPTLRSKKAAEKDILYDGDDEHGESGGVDDYEGKDNGSETGVVDVQQ